MNLLFVISNKLHGIFNILVAGGVLCFKWCCIVSMDHVAKKINVNGGAFLWACSQDIQDIMQG